MMPLIQKSKSLLAEMLPLTAVRGGRMSGGPRFSRDGKSWLIEGGSGQIFVPYIRRYGMYRNCVRRRISSMLPQPRKGTGRAAASPSE